MSDEAGSMDVYLFEIGEDSEGFAKFVHVYHRHPSTTHEQALAEIQGLELLPDWKDETLSHASDALDMRFQGTTKAIIFVRLPEKNGVAVTEFGKKVLIDLDIAPRIPNNIVRKCRSFASHDGKHRLCSFELDVPAAVGAMRRPASGHQISRLPIMFDFVDSDDGISPVFKKPHHHSSAAPVFGHGGIHPRGGSSLIVIE